MATSKKHADLPRVDPVVEAFRADIDVTLLERNLPISVEERSLQLMELQPFARELAAGGRRATQGSARGV
jgi:hypothetical protein